MGAFYNCYVENSAKEISEVLGPSYSIDDDKTIRQWDGCVENNDFYIYDYKAYRNIKKNEVYPYHIGAENEKISLKVVEYLKGLGLNAYYKPMFM